MSDSLKTPKPSVSFDSQFEREESQVRDRGRPTVPSPAPADAIDDPTQKRASATAKPSETVAERTRRIEQKVSVASLLLRRLSPVDPRARLLSSAVLRKDEVLLDAVLAQMTEEVFALVRSR